MLNLKYLRNPSDLYVIFGVENEEYILLNHLYSCLIDLLAKLACKESLVCCPSFYYTNLKIYQYYLLFNLSSHLTAGVNAGK